MEVVCVFEVAESCHGFKLKVKWSFHPIISQIRACRLPLISIKLFWNKYTLMFRIISVGIRESTTCNICGILLEKHIVITIRIQNRSILRFPGIVPENKLIFINGCFTFRISDSQTFGFHIEAMGIYVAFLDGSYPHGSALRVDYARLYFDVGVRMLDTFCSLENKVTGGECRELN